jgi:flagellar biosynthesis protein FliR
MFGLESMVVRFMFAMARFAPVLVIPALTPFAWVPGLIRVTLLMAVAVLAMAVAPLTPVAVGIDQPIAFGLALLGESAYGLALALAVVLPMAAIGFSARVVDIQSGVAAMALFNPSVRTTESMAGTVFQWAGTLVFFALGFHLLLLKGLIVSTQLAPLGSAGLALTPGQFTEMLGAQFMLGFAVVAPVVLGLFAIDLGIAFASRSMPQANVYFVALPLKVAAAFLLLAADMTFAPRLIGRVFARAFGAVSNGLVH